MGPPANSPARSELGADLPRTERLFRLVRRGLRMRAALRSAEAATAVLLGCWLVSMIADAVFSLSAGPRFVALAATCAAPAAVFGWSVARGAASRIGPVYLASRFEALYPVFAGRLIAAVELAVSAGRGEAAEDAVTEGAARLVFEQAEALADEVDPARIVAAEADRTRAHKYLLWSMALVLAAALAMGREFPDFAARSLFPWLSPEAPDAAFFWVRPTVVEVEEGERFAVDASLRGPAPERVTLEISLEEGPGGKGGAEGSAARVLMEEGSVPRRWAAEAGPVDASGRYRLVAEYGRRASPLETGWYPLRLLLRPRLRSVSVSYVYPEYTRRADRRERGGTVDAPVGTTATVEIVPERALARATAVVGDSRGAGPRRIPMRRVPRRTGGDGAGPPRRPDGRAWRFGFGVARSGSYWIELESADGVVSRSESFPVVARRDRPPRCEVSFLEPSDDEAPEVFARGAGFRVRASDDFGLQELVLVVRRRDERGGAAGETSGKRGPDYPEGPSGRGVPAGKRGEKRDVHYIRVPGFAAGSREFSQELRVPPQVLPVEPGVTYAYYVRAADGFPVSPHLTTSPEKTFRVARGVLKESMLAHARRKKRRPPLLEPQEDRPRGGSGPRGGAGADASRSLTGLSDGEGAGQAPARGRKPPESPYASGPGLGGGRSGDEGKDGNEGGASGAKEGDGGSPGEAASTGRGSRGGGRSGPRPQLPGQGGLPEAGRAPERERTAAGGPPASGQGAGEGSGGPRGAGRGPGSGGPRGPRREAPDATGSGPEGGGRANAGLQDKRTRDGGMPTGAETGTGEPIPETVDRGAVDSLDVTRDEAANGVKDVRVPGRRPGEGSGLSGSGGPPSDLESDLGPGRDRRIGPAEGRDRVRVSKDDLPTPAVVRSAPVSRMYRALVDEYFRRLEELAD